jgi:hypothetical protein
MTRSFKKYEILENLNFFGVEFRPGDQFIVPYNGMNKDFNHAEEF